MVALSLCGGGGGGLGGGPDLDEVEPRTGQVEVEMVVVGSPTSD